MVLENTMLMLTASWFLNGRMGWTAVKRLRHNIVTGVSLIHTITGNGAIGVAGAIAMFREPAIGKWIPGLFIDIVIAIKLPHITTTVGEIGRHGQRLQYRKPAQGRLSQQPSTITETA